MNYAEPTLFGRIILTYGRITTNENNLPTKDIFFSVGKLAFKLRAATTTTLYSTTTIDIYIFFIFSGN
jgi:hypothetical protein